MESTRNNTLADFPTFTVVTTVLSAVLICICYFPIDVWMKIVILLYPPLQLALSKLYADRKQAHLLAFLDDFILFLIVINRFARIEEMTAAQVYGVIGLLVLLQIIGVFVLPNRKVKIISFIKENKIDDYNYIYKITDPSKRGFEFENWLIKTFNKLGHKARNVRDMKVTGEIQGITGYDGGMDVYVEFSDGTKGIIQAKFYSSPLEEEVLLKTSNQFHHEFKKIFGENLKCAIVSNQKWARPVEVERAKQQNINCFVSNNLKDAFESKNWLF